MEDKQCKIHVTNLKKNFGKLEVLKDISVDVQEGEVVVLLGPSGSGKSTLLRCLNQLETATSGKIIIDGHDVTDKHTDINKVRENIGMVFQHFNLFNHLTVLDNMTLAPVHLKLMNKEEARTEALRLLERVGLADKADAFPSQLSGGQKQRVAIALSLIHISDRSSVSRIWHSLHPWQTATTVSKNGRWMAAPRQESGCLMNRSPWKNWRGSLAVPRSRMQ